MYGDFARVTFDALKNRSRVLQQQGRVQLEADWNEQGAIFLHMMRTLTKDLVGPAAGPESNCGFGVITREWLQGLPASDKRREWLRLLNDANDFLISKGHYYVDGLLCDNTALVPYSNQPARMGAPLDKLALTPDALYLAYLDVAEHAVFGAQDDSMIEVALGMETAIRARVSWVVRTVPLKDGHALEDMEPSWTDLLEKWQSASRGWLKCRAGDGTAGSPSEPCNVAPQSRFRGPENQLYRIEVHKGGVFEPPRKGKRPKDEPAEDGDRPTFKFSRINGSAVFKIESMKGDVVTLADLGRDDRFNLDEGDWVEILDDRAIVPNNPGPLRSVAAVDTFKREVTLSPAPAGSVVIGTDDTAHPILRRWDQRPGDPKARGLQLHDGVAPIELGNWIGLEDGIEIQFQGPPDATGPIVLRSGDYWLAPARVATGGVIDWPQVEGEPQAIPPHGVEHHFAPLAILKVVKGDLTIFSQCRRVFEVPSKVLQKTL
ncbi:MAG: hypothetical protein H0W08_14685 [Acidobacteria bacterium]|nr:hypothetical protein [Acidobacteriota bacterium]